MAPSIKELRDAALKTKDEGLIIYLRNYPDLVTRMNLAQNKNLPVYLQWEMYRDKDSRVLASLASNPALYPEIAYYLLKYKGSKTVKQKLASNTNAVDNLLELLADDGEWEIRYNVATNPVCSNELLLKLSKDGNESVSKAAYSSLHKRLNS